jgi:serine phosphatase RsbU (regulator of sigma subunit)
MKRIKEAKKYALGSIRYSEKLSDSTTIADGYLRLAECFRVENKFDSAQYYLNQSIRINTKLKSYHQLAYALEIQSMLYDSVGNYKKALESNKELLQVKDSLLNSEKTSQMIEMQTKFDTERKVRENELLTEQNHNQKLTLYSLVIFIVLVLALALNIYFSRKRIRKSNQNLLLLNSELQQQKEEILTQSENLQQANDAIRQQKDLVEASHRKITDSIAYASIIQSAMLPADCLTQGFFSDSFIYYSPRDIVSGDFYWYKEKNGSLIFAVADCTGHGVPGSLLSIMGISYLNEIINTSNEIKPSIVLDELRNAVKSTFGQSASTDLRKEGIEIAFCVFNPQSKVLEYSGARLSLWISRNGNVQEYPADKLPIGLPINETPFQVTQVKLEKNDIIYLFTDGITDQLGAQTGKKYLRKNFIEFLKQISDKPLDYQKDSINEMFLNWKGSSLDQTDDILVLGLKV